MSEKYILRARRNDRIARWIITAGGVAIIATVILILVLIVEVTLPLFLPVGAEPLAEVSLPAQLRHEDVLLLDADEYMRDGLVLTRGGRCVFFDLKTGTVKHTENLAEDASRGEALACSRVGAQQYCMRWSSGLVTIVTPDFGLSEAENHGVAKPYAVEELQSIPASVEPGEIATSVARYTDEGLVTRVDLLANNTFRVAQRSVSTDLMGNESVEAYESLIDGLPGGVSAYTLDTQGEWLYAGTADGQLIRWDLGNLGSPKLVGAHKATEDNVPVTALEMVFGDVSVAVGTGSGKLTTWFPVRKTPEAVTKQLAPIHDLAPHDSAVTSILTSRRNKSLVSLGKDGSIHLDYPTSEQHLLSLSRAERVVKTGYTARGDGILALTEANRICVWRIDNPHPEISLSTLFGKVWYEGYDAPEYTWQSSASTDDFEPKISLVPLLYGSIKGTFYAMLYAIPLALFGAVYTSHFAQGRIRNVIKSTVETMAAIPSVVIGFLAALWLAPIIERYTVTFLLGIMIVPVLIVIFVMLIQPLRQRPFLKQVEQGFEFVLMVPVVLLACTLSYMLAGPLEALLFGGDLKQWLFESAGQRYDQRNCVVISFALGFAVIPIIFTIAEDALSNVPNSLKAASLALGASRWQTVWRVVLPSASPGIFAGIIIGFGRAVGETMIVLMATGNTPVLDMSIFNGMRTLSANIAVEIPEAPLGGTLYRVLFLSAVILLVFTSILNTMAELIRQRLRSKYGLNN